MSGEMSKPAPILMTNKHKLIITQNFEDLTQNLTAASVLSYLVSEGIITLSEHDNLLQEKEQIAKAGALLSLLLKREDRTFYTLIEACEKKGMKHLAKLLRDAEAEEENEETDNNAAKQLTKEEAAGGAGDGIGETEIDIVSVNYDGKVYEVEVESDGTIELSTIGQVVPEGLKVRGLQFKHPATGKTRLVPLKNGKLGPPRNGWGRIEYAILADSPPKTSITKEESSAHGKQGHGDKVDGPMTPEHRTILEKNKPALTYSMKPSGVMMHLRSMSVMTLQDQENIEHGRGESDQAAALIDLILKQNDSAFEKLRKALHLSNQEFLAKLLKA